MRVHTHPQHEQLTDYYPCLSSCVSIHLNYLYYNIRKIHIATKISSFVFLFLSLFVCLSIELNVYVFARVKARIAEHDQRTEKRPR